MIKIRQWLIDKRTTAGKSQQEVADAVGVDRTFITMLERGSRDPSVRVAKLLGIVLEFDWQIFFANECDKTGHSA